MNMKDFRNFENQILPTLTVIVAIISGVVGFIVFPALTVRFPALMEPMGCVSGAMCVLTLALYARLVYTLGGFSR